ncbi:hypothetical protein Tco_1047087 [Tanacetum coccineum]
MSSLKALIKQYNERSGTQIEPIRLSFGEKEENDKEKNTDKETGDTKTKTFRNHLKRLQRMMDIQNELHPRCVGGDADLSLHEQLQMPRIRAWNSQEDNSWKKDNECYPEENYPQGLFTKEDVRGRTTVMTSTSTEITTSRMFLLGQTTKATKLQLQIPPCPLMVETPKKENLDIYCDYHEEKEELHQ